MPQLFVLEGLDGSGKSTQMELLKQWIQQQGRDFKQIKLPDYDHPSSALVQMYLKGAFGGRPEDVNAYAASSFYAVDRYASYQQYWKADYQQGRLILADRYATSNAIYQMVKLPPEEWESYLFWMEDFEYGKLGIPRPDRVFFLDMPIEVSQKLMTKRYHGHEEKKDVHESHPAFLQACREAALFSAGKLGWQVINCAENGHPLSIQSIHQKIIALL